MNLFGNSTQFFVDFVPKLPMLILGLLAGYIGIKIVVMSIRKGLRLVRAPKPMIDIALPLSSAVLWIIFFSEFARHLGLSGIAVTFSGLLVVVGLAISNGAAATVSDLIASVFLAKDRDFSVGFKVKFEDKTGIIKAVDPRKVRIETNDGHIIIVPTSKFDSTGWEVISKNL